VRLHCFAHLSPVLIGCEGVNALVLTGVDGACVCGWLYAGGRCTRKPATATLALQLLTLHSLAVGRQRAGGDELIGGGRCGPPQPGDSGVIHYRM
jgi:hypothetical protein